jgi:hypothetical protein
MPLTTTAKAHLDGFIEYLHDEWNGFGRWVWSEPRD